MASVWNRWLYALPLLFGAGDEALLGPLLGVPLNNPHYCGDIRRILMDRHLALHIDHIEEKPDSDQSAAQKVMAHFA